MGEENGSDSTALAIADSEEQWFPCLRWGRGQYAFPKAECQVTVKEALPVTLDEFVSFMGVGTSPSRSPEKWRQYLTVSNYGIVKTKEGVYPFAMFDVVGHPQMKNTVHLIPSEPAAKLLPALYEAAKEDPEAHGLKLASKSDSQRAKHQARLDGLQWKPEMCMGTGKSGATKPTSPSPTTNAWKPLPPSFWIKWCVTPEKRATPSAGGAASKGGSGSKRERDEDAELLGSGIRARTDLGFGNVAMLASIPVGEHYSTKVVGGRLEVTVYADGADEEGAEGALEAPAEGEAEA